jgi:hypothetical protein
LWRPSKSLQQLMIKLSTILAHDRDLVEWTLPPAVHGPVAVSPFAVVGGVRSAVVPGTRRTAGPRLSISPHSRATVSADPASLDLTPPPSRCGTCTRPASSIAGCSREGACCRPPMLLQ